MFKVWLQINEGIDFGGLSRMWKKLRPDDKDEQIKSGIDMIALCDPTPDKEYVNWLAREVLNNRIRLPEDKGIIGEDLLYFNDLKKRNQLKKLGIDSNIINYTRHQLQDKVEEIQSKISGKSKRQEIKDIKTVGAKKLFDNGHWMVIEAITKDACINYGKGTKWCTAALEDNQADNYLRDGPLYIVLKDKFPFMQFHLPEKQLMDVRDEEIDSADVPEDLKNILCSVIAPKFNGDRLNFASLFGKVDNSSQKLLDSGIVYTESINGYKIYRIMNSFTFMHLIGERKTYNFNRINFDEYKVNYLTGDDFSCIWWFFNDPVNSSDLGEYWIKVNSYSFVSYRIFFNEVYHMRSLWKHTPLKIREVISKTFKNGNYQAAVSIYSLTGIESSLIDSIMIDRLENSTLSQMDIDDNFSYPMWVYLKNKKDFNHSIFETVRKKIKDLYGEIKNDSDKIANPISKAKYMNKETYNLDELFDVLAKQVSKDADHENLEYLIDLAKEGSYQAPLLIKPLYKVWTEIFEMDKGKFSDKQWKESEPYLAIYDVYSGNMKFCAPYFIKDYAVDENEFNEVMTRMRQFYDAAKSKMKP